MTRNDALALAVSELQRFGSTSEPETPEIEVALAECRKAWAEFYAEYGIRPEGDEGRFGSRTWKFKNRTPVLAWCLHHTQHYEKLLLPVENRIDYILRNKPVTEQAARFINLRPMSLKSTRIVLKAEKAFKGKRMELAKEFEDATKTERMAYTRAVKDGRNVSDSLPAVASWKTYNSAVKAAARQFEKNVAEKKTLFHKANKAEHKAFDKVVTKAHLADYPNTTWNGKSIFKGK